MGFTFAHGLAPELPVLSMTVHCTWSVSGPRAQLLSPPSKMLPLSRALVQVCLPLGPAVGAFQPWSCLSVLETHPQATLDDVFWAWSGLAVFPSCGYSGLNSDVKSLGCRTHASE